ncbi:MAG: YbaB/EbfC family nucleoid-associated protein [Tissierellia bacterium]|jgi:DNA-binding YbaB/EbfC family protein|nr:YbaB/EbfC family nucleoid-associated protein [Bacillota bacterium]NLK58358.1 YbaB/EbfC family nucleoid-associated protein [Tissierellia bacterium]
MRRGYPGMGGQNMNQMMKQMQKMQKQMEETQAKLEAEEITAQAGGGVVEATVNGKRELVHLVIDPDAVDPDDVDMLQDLIIAAVNEAMREAEQKAEREMKKVTGGLNIPGL